MSRLAVLSVLVAACSALLSGCAGTVAAAGGTHRPYDQRIAEQQVQQQLVRRGYTTAPPACQQPPAVAPPSEDAGFSCLATRTDAGMRGHALEVLANWYFDPGRAQVYDVEPATAANTAAPEPTDRPTYRSSTPEGVVQHYLTGAGYTVTGVSCPTPIATSDTGCTAYTTTGADATVWLRDHHGTIRVTGSHVLPGPTPLPSYATRTAYSAAQLDAEVRHRLHDLGELGEHQLLDLSCPALRLGPNSTPRRVTCTPPSSPATARTGTRPSTSCSP